MRAFKPLMLILVLAGVSATSSAATIYTSSASFLTQVSAGAYTDAFTGLSDPSSGNFSGGGYAYTATAASGLYVSAGLLGTNQINEALEITFTSGNVTAFGANFYSTDISDQFQSVSVTLSLSDGTTFSFTPTTLADSYVGFTSNVAITSLTISAPGPSLYAGLDNLTVGAAVSAVPEPTSVALMGLGMLGLLAGSRRMSQARA